MKVDDIAGLCMVAIFLVVIFSFLIYGKWKESEYQELPFTCLKCEETYKNIDSTSYIKRNKEYKICRFCIDEYKKQLVEDYIKKIEK